MRKPTYIFRSHRALVAAAVFALAASMPLARAVEPPKVLHVAFSSAEMSFDPPFSADAAIDGLIDHIFESMLDNDELLRPARLLPRTLIATRPAMTSGLAWTILRTSRRPRLAPDPRSPNAFTRHA